MLRSPLTALLVLATGAAPRLSAAPLAAPKAPASLGLAAEVNPLVGSAEHGHTYPGAQVPFGLVQLSPDTPLQGWDGSSGYHYSDNQIRGFSHTHLSGTGVGGLGDVLLMPTVGAASVEQSAYTSPFSHARESASPGYYRVFLQKPRVIAELSSTARAGIHRYTFPASDQSHIVLDLQHGIGNTVLESSLRIENATTLSGTRISNGWGGRREVFFVIQFSKPFLASGIEQEGVRLTPGATEAAGKSVKSVVSFQTTEGEQIVVKVGISGTSVEGARRNLSAEIPDFDFARVRQSALSQWNELLGKIRIESRDPKIRRTFATNFYQSCLAPVLFNDVDKTYRGLDKQNHTGAAFDNYTTFSLWDTFRAQHPLLTVVAPQRVPDMVNSMLAHYAERNREQLPVWPLWGNETGTMIGYHSAPVIVDAYLKGFQGFNPEVAYQALRLTAFNGRNGQGEFGQNGYVTSSTAGQKQSVSRTLEYAFDDWCIAQMAQKLGHTADAKLFLARSAHYRNLYDSRVGFMRGRRADGSWRVPFNPKQHIWADYTEANAWQYLWTAMHDSPGLVQLLGGDAAFIAKMETMFNEKDDVVTNIPDITGLIGQYAHGNEPVHHAAYLYNYAGAPYKTQERVRQIMDLFYNDTPVGAPGNNDCGQMSAWYVWSALGFYPVNPVGGVYVIGSPQVERATLQVGPNGRTFTVVAADNSPQNLYIQSATLNGRPLQNSYFTHDQLMAGGELRLQMGPKPDLSWGKALANRPPTGMPSGFRYAALPAPSVVKPRVAMALPIRIVAGSDARAGNFVPDEDMLDGSTNANDGGVDTSAPGAGPEKMYQSERYGADFSYRIAVPTGARYTVRLHFAEIFQAAAGERVQNIDLNGKRVLSNFSIAAEAGQNKALVKEFPGIAPDAAGDIVIRISAAPGSRDQNAKISGIEILKP